MAITQSSQTAIEVQSVASSTPANQTTEKGLDGDFYVAIKGEVVEKSGSDIKQMALDGADMSSLQVMTKDQTSGWVFAATLGFKADKPTSTPPPDPCIAPSNSATYTSSALNTEAHTRSPSEYLKTHFPNLSDTYSLKQTEQNLFKLLLADEIDLTLHNDYLIKGLLDRGSFSCIYGAPGSAKTFIVLDMAVAIATGRLWCDLKVSSGAVLYIALEGHSGFKRRILALKQTGKLPTNAPFVTMMQPLRIFEEDQVEKLISAIKDKEKEHNFKFALVVIDTLAHAMAGTDENSTQDMMAAVEGFQKLGTSIESHVMIVHHSGKDSSKGSRGNSSLKGAVDSEFECCKVKDTERGFMLKTTKQKDLDGLSNIYFMLGTVKLTDDEDGDPVTSCVVNHVDKLMSASEVEEEAINKAKISAMVELLPQESMTAWYKDAVESNALGADTTVAKAKNFVDRKMVKGTDYQTSDAGTGKNKRVTPGTKWITATTEPTESSTNSG